MRMSESDGDACIHVSVEKHAQLTPSAVAISAPDETIDYRTLNDRADRMAERLRSCGTGAGDRVAIALGRSPDLVVAMLSASKIGAAYVPVDPSYPEERKAFILDDADVAIMIVGKDTDIPGTEQTPVVHIDRPSTDPVVATPAPAVPVVGADTCYVIYTSGSTGTPKGIPIRHESVMALVHGDPRVRVAPGETVVQFAPASFDASTFEIWAALCNGGRIAILASGDLSADRLATDLERLRPDWLFLTTGLFHVLVDHRTEALRFVRRLITGGDVLSPASIGTAAEVPGLELYAAYGPTETTVFTSLFPPQPEQALERVPIGTPLKGVSMNIVDETGTEVAEGEIGEIVIGGTGLADGYHNRPGLTAERFVPAPDPAPPGTRLYRTGDLGRFLENGDVEFRGRADRQIKHRGYRVELGEIESVLQRLDGVAGAAVVASKPSEGHKRLVAFVAISEGSDVSVSDLRSWLRRCLPSFMEPGTIVLTDELPLDSNGKIDRKALPPAWTARDEITALEEYVEPRNEAERTMAFAWTEVLDLDRVGIDDNFYELGGDSLLSVELIEQLSRLGFRVSPVQLFQYQSVRELVEVLREHSSTPVTVEN